MLKNIRKLEDTDDFGMAPGRGMRPFLMEVLVDAARIPNFATIVQALTNEFISLDQQFGKLCGAFYNVILEDSYTAATELS